MDEKCAPSKSYKDGSCFSLKSLKKIAESYNLKNPNKKILISDNKNKLVNELENRLKDKCNDQTCWLRMDFVTAIKDEEIEENTFRPEGPKNKTEWLSTTDINNVVSQYQEKFKSFLFLGAVPADFQDLEILGISNLNFNDLIKDNKHEIGMVINLDESWKSGSHWVGFYANLKKNQVYYFDSFGKKPYKRTRKFVNKILKFLYKNKYNKEIKINKLIKNLKGGSSKKIDDLQPFDIKYNTIQHQFSSSECGVYSINFVVRLVSGESFKDITENITKDPQMNECRATYFRNINSN
jgi:hypothetical protein